MSREYRHIKQYEKEILELKEKGLTKREIGEKLGFSKEQVRGIEKRLLWLCQENGRSRMGSAAGREDPGVSGA